MTSDIPTMPRIAPPIPVVSLNGRKPREVVVEPDAALCAEVARYLDLTALRKLRFAGSLTPKGAADWDLSGHLGATVVQPCAVTLAPVTTRIDARVTRHFVAAWSEPDGDEVEMTMDDTLEPLGTSIDLSALLIEALALAAPDFPRSEGAALNADGVLRAAPDGETVLDDDAVKPFAGLAGLLDKLKKT